MFRGIDFSSDTVTKPTAAMRRAMADAEVGDEQKGEDPTTRRLEEMTAQMLGKSNALFFPSATMANEVALLALGRPGDILLAAENCHLFLAEAGGPAVLAQLLARPLATENGIFTAEQVRAAAGWSPRTPLAPVPRVLSVENTTNMGGGVPWSPHALSSVLEAARELGLSTHLDGSRLMHAAIATAQTPEQIARPFDMVTICLSKGLGCPAGAILAFDKQRFADVRRLKQRMGGSMRQSGILAAAGIYALGHNVTRLGEDHVKARELADLLGECRPHLKVENSPPSTNMVFLKWNGGRSCSEFLSLCAENGVRFSQVGENRIRAVTHLDIKPEDIGAAARIVARVVASLV